MRKLLLLLGGILACSLWPVSQGLAQTPKKIGENHAWVAYTYKDNGNTVCFMASAPEKMEGKYTRRDDPFALVTHHPAEGVSGEASLVAGYTYRKDSDVTVTIGERNFSLVTEDDRAWTSGTEDDARLVKAMISGIRMTVVGYSSRGTKTTDTYSLKGFTATKKLIDQACK